MVKRCRIEFTGRDGSKNVYQLEGESLFEAAAKAMSFAEGQHWFAKDIPIQVLVDKKLYKVMPSKVAEWRSEEIKKLFTE